MKEDILTSILAELSLIIGAVIISSVLLVVWKDSISQSPASFLILGIVFVALYVIAKVSLNLKKKKSKHETKT